jgi:hypothetical protein
MSANGLHRRIQESCKRIEIINYGAPPELTEIRRDMDIDLTKLTTNELIDLYARIPDALKNRGVIRTKNFLGDLGEYIAIQHYNSTPGLPKLQAAPPGTQNVDAMSCKGDRYSIKSTRSNGTGVFYGLADPESQQIDKQKFEYVIVVQFFDNFKVRRILELSWEHFLKHKRWHSRMRAWNLSISQSLVADSKVLIDNF